MKLFYLLAVVFFLYQNRSSENQRNAARTDDFGGERVDSDSLPVFALAVALALGVEDAGGSHEAK